MNKTLQDRFVETDGMPIKIGVWVVTQLSRIPISRGRINVQITSPPNSDQGICLKAKDGFIELPDGSQVERLHIWHEPGALASATYSVHCPHKELLVWNIYRVHHPTGETTEDHWTGNAGIVLVDDQPQRRRYVCSDWRSPFDPTAIAFEVEWRGASESDENGDG
jgi:hypothetical protein